MRQENDNFQNLTEDQVIKYRPLIYKIASRMDYGYIDKDDLIQAGFIGLMKAFNRFNQEKSNNFLSYASVYIINSMKEELRNNKLIVLNKDMISLIRQIRSNEELSFDELSKKLSVNKDKICLAFLYKDKVQSLDQCDGFLIDDIQSNIKYNEITDKISLLKENDRRLIYYKYFYNYNQSEIAKTFNVSQSTVSRLEKEALYKLKGLVLKE